MTFLEFLGLAFLIIFVMFLIGGRKTEDLYPNWSYEDCICSDHLGVVIEEGFGARAGMFCPNCGKEKGDI
jgi:hypothetical protein